MNSETKTTDVSAARAGGARLYRELTAEVEKHRALGLVDCKMKVVPNLETTAAGVIRTLTNVLRLVSSGRPHPLNLG